MKTAKVCMVLLFVSLAMNLWQLRLLSKRHASPILVACPEFTPRPRPGVILQSGAAVIFGNVQDDTNTHETWENEKRKP